MDNIFDGFDKISTSAGISQQHQLRERIGVLLKSRKLEVGGRLPSIRKVSRHFGLSQITAQQVYDSLQQAGYIRKSQGKGCFLKPLSRNFPLVDTGKVSVSVKPPADGKDFNLPTANLLSGFFIGLSGIGWSANIETGLVGGGEFDGICKNYLNRCIDGAAIIGGIDNFEKKIRLAQDYSLPLVLINNYHAELCSVVADVEGACSTMTERLLEKGCRNFAILVSESANPRFAGIVSGVRKALQQKGLELNPNHVRVYSTETLPEQYETMKQDVAQMISQSGGIDAFFCAPELRTLAALKVLEQCTNQVQVVSVDDSTDIDLQYPEIQRIRVPYFKMAVAGAQALGRLVNGTGNGTGKIKISCQLSEEPK